MWPLTSLENHEIAHIPPGKTFVFWQPARKCMKSYHDYASFCPAKHVVYSVLSTEGRFECKHRSHRLFVSANTNFSSVDWNRNTVWSWSEDSGWIRALVVSPFNAWIRALVVRPFNASSPTTLQPSPDGIHYCVQLQSSRLSSLLPTFSTWSKKRKGKGKLGKESSSITRHRHYFLYANKWKNCWENIMSILYLQCTAECTEEEETCIKSPFSITYLVYF